MIFTIIKRNGFQQSSWDKEAANSNLGDRESRVEITAFREARLEKSHSAEAGAAGDVRKVHPLIPPLHYIGLHTGGFLASSPTLKIRHSTMIFGRTEMVILLYSFSSLAAPRSRLLLKRQQLPLRFCASIKCLLQSLGHGTHCPGSDGATIQFQHRAELAHRSCGKHLIGAVTL